MHLAHFVQRFPPALGGSEAYFARLGEYLVGRGDTVNVWTTTAIDLEAFWKKGKKELPQSANRSGVLRFLPLRFPGRRYILKAASLLPFPAWQAVTLPCNPICPGMWRAVKRYDGPLDAVHATAFPYAFPILCGLNLARRRGVPFLLSPFLHLGDPTDPHDRTRKQYTFRPLRWLLRQADRVFVQTPSEREMAIELGVPERKVVLQGLGVEPAECTGGNREAARSRWNASPNEVAIGHLANNSVEKGTVDLLKAVERMGVDCRVVLAGPEMANFKIFWESYGPKHRFTRLGVLSESEKRDFFAGIDLFALPSRSDSFGLVLLEAWANGKPVVAYRAGGPADLIRDGIDGRLAPCGNVEKLAECMAELIRNSATRDAMGAAGRKRVGEEFRWEDKLKRVRDVSSEAISEGKRVRGGASTLFSFRRGSEWSAPRSAPTRGEKMDG
ncbi:MAG TPA: glycosyltransferase family 4 protein [Fimbriiglobus sp.]|jgi:glycosyltransferase involved in cell wall biosynthesis